MMISSHGRKRLFIHEALRLKPYIDTTGHTSIGIGRNLDVIGISKKEAEYLFENDLERAYQEADKYKWFHDLCQPRKDVVINMIFNLGAYGFGKFKRTIGHLENGDYHLAGDEMLDSKWAKQVGYRAKELSEQMKTGNYHK